MKKKRPTRKRNATYDIIESRKRRGAEFLRRIGKKKEADALDFESVKDYAARKGLTIEDAARKGINPRKKARKKPSALPARKRGVKGRVNARKRPRKKNKGLLGKLFRGAVKGAKAAGRFAASKDARTSYEKKTPFSKTRKSGQKHGMTQREYDAFSERMRLQGVRNPKRRTKKKRNSEHGLKEAAGMYERFHGKPAGAIITVLEEDEARKDYAKLGDLVKLEVDGKHCLVFKTGEGTILACDPKGRQLYIIGGSQNVDSQLDVLGVDKSKDLIDLGECTQIEYFTRKKFDNFQPVQYYHEFGEETGVCPRLMYNRINKRLFLIGGEYQIKEEGITN